VPVITHSPSLPTVDAGVYDPYHAFDRVHTLAYEAVWVSWDRYKKGQLAPKLKKIAYKGRQPIITIEPFPIKSIGTADTLLRDIAAGKYDAVISRLARDVSSIKGLAYIRWGAEMEHTEAYPWAKKPPNDYIAAFRHFVGLFKQGYPDARFVWSPVGNEGCEAYHPGDDVVDFTGFSIYKLPVSSIGWFGHPMSFTDWMDNKYPRIAQYNKPMILVEVGVSDTRENQKIWLANAFAALPNYPLAKAFVYSTPSTFTLGKNGEARQRLIGLSIRNSFPRISRQINFPFNGRWMSLSNTSVKRRESPAAIRRSTALIVGII
jgi:endoglucanase